MLWTVARRSLLASSLGTLKVPLEAKREAIALSCFLVDEGRLGIGLMLIAGAGVGSELCRVTGGDAVIAGECAGNAIAAMEEVGVAI